MELSVLQICLLSVLLVGVFVLPLSVHKVEENLEIFLFCCGVTAVSISHVWSWPLVEAALKDPIKITLAVLIAGFLFRQFNTPLQHITQKAVAKIGLRWTMFLIVCILGLVSSLITAIIAALVLAEVVVMLPLVREQRVKLVVLACFSIGMGAVLTAIGEPLGTIVISKLSGAPHHAGFFYLIEHVGWFVLAGILLMGILAARLKAGKHAPGEHATDTREDRSLKSILMRTAKVYLFVMALVLLGDGLKPFALRTVSHLSENWLYWINSVSAVLDNATLAAIEVTPEISDRSLTFLLMSLILSGGMMIPGNIPNIICASKLGIKSKEWVKNALGLGAAMMAGFFVLLHIVL